MVGKYLVFNDSAVRLAVRLATALGFRAAILHVHCKGNMTEVLEIAYLRPEIKIQPGSPQPSWLWPPDWVITPLDDGEIALDHPTGDYPRQIFVNPSEAVKAAFYCVETDSFEG